MIAIDTMRLTLATIEARLTDAWPGALRSCAIASAAGAFAGCGKRASAALAITGISRSVPISKHAIAAYPKSGTPSIGGSVTAPRRAR